MKNGLTHLGLLSFFFKMLVLPKESIYYKIYKNIACRKNNPKTSFLSIAEMDGPEVLWTAAELSDGAMEARLKRGSGCTLGIDSVRCLA